MALYFNSGLLTIHGEYTNTEVSLFEASISKTIGCCAI